MVNGQRWVLPTAQSSRHTGSLQSIASSFPRTFPGYPWELWGWARWCLDLILHPLPSPSLKQAQPEPWVLRRRTFRRSPGKYPQLLDRRCGQEPSTLREGQAPPGLRRSFTQRNTIACGRQTPSTPAPHSEKRRNRASLAEEATEKLIRFYPNKVQSFEIWKPISIQKEVVTPYLLSQTWPRVLLVCFFFFNWHEVSKLLNCV